MPEGYDKPEVWHAAHLVDTGQVEIGGLSIAILDGYFKAWDRQGREAERERIIGLLNGDGRFVGARRLLIELIEGTDDSG
jgi:hypothetical protein